MDHDLLINSRVPFGETIFWWLRVAHEHDLEKLIDQSRNFNKPYLAWEMVRRRRNPYFQNGTGFEGYFIGIARTPEEALEQVLRIGEEMLISILRLHRFDAGFRSRLMRTLIDELGDADAITEWATQLGATLARLRCNLLDNREADRFQEGTYRLVSRLPEIEYVEDQYTLRQIYLLNTVEMLPGEHFDTRRISVSLEGLPRAEQDAWMVARLVGKFGHPLVRQLAAHQR